LYQKTAQKARGEKPRKRAQDAKTAHGRRREKGSEKNHRAPTRQRKQPPRKNAAQRLDNAARAAHTAALDAFSNTEKIAKN
jgi:hypothetical protein